MKPGVQRIHPDDRDRAYDELQEALRQKGEYAIEYRLVLPDGTVKHIRSIGHPLRTPRMENSSRSSARPPT